MKLMKNLGDQFGDDDDEDQGELKRRKQEKEKLAANRRPPDVVLEHANDSYTQRFCTFSKIIIMIQQFIIIIIIIIIIQQRELSSWQSHCESSLGSRTEYRNGARWPPTFRPSQGA